jgi:hypothetical protein
MPMKLYNEASIQDIADAIRTKNGLTDTYKVAEMAQAIIDLPSGIGAVTITDTTDSHGGTIRTITAVTVEETEFYQDYISAMTALGV